MNAKEQDKEVRGLDAKIIFAAISKRAKLSKRAKGPHDLVVLGAVSLPYFTMLVLSCLWGQLSFPVAYVFFFALYSAVMIYIFLSIRISALVELVDTSEKSLQTLDVAGHEAKQAAGR
ncbi:MAG: hypothetical protein O7H41_15980 [Planctomycetota bacterium]|nr:hypothetical protein [Planctomycetota bacterium]